MNLTDARALLTAMNDSPGLRAGGGDPARARRIQSEVLPELSRACERYKLPKPFWLTKSLGEVATGQRWIILAKASTPQSRERRQRAASARRLHGFLKGIALGTQIVGAASDASPAQAPVRPIRVHVSAGDGPRHTALLCTKTGRLYSSNASALRKALTPCCDDCAGYPSRVELRKALREHVELRKAIDSKCFSDPKSCGLRWITAHPNDREPGVPLLVHDNGEQYTVVGGAGGRMNQMVFQKPKDHDAANISARAAKRKEAKAKKQEAAREALGEEGVKALEEKKAALKEEVAKQTEELHGKILEKLDDSFKGHAGGALAKVEQEARKRAEKIKPDATPEEKKEFADKAAKEAVDGAKEAAKKLVAQALDAAAKKALGDHDGTPEDFKASINGQTLLKQFTPEDLDEFIKASADISALKGQARAIQRALASGDQDTLSGVEAVLKPISDEAAAKENLDRYLNEQSVNANTALVKGAEEASTINQNRNGAAGAADGLNAFVGAATGRAVMLPHVVQKLGTENAARVAAAYLMHAGGDGKQIADGLRTRIASSSFASAKAALDECASMDARVKLAKEAADSGDGSVTKSQASIMAANMAASKYRLLNVARGQLRSAAALAHHLENPSERPMAIKAGDTAVTATAFAKGIGLKPGDYTLRKAERGEGGGYMIDVAGKDLHKIATEHSVKESERSLAMDALRQDVEHNPGQWRPDGLNPDINLRPHQELATRAIVQEKRAVLNMGAGSGKTAVLYSTAAHLLNTGKIDRALISMPKGPRSQQGMDYEDPDEKGPDGKPVIKPAQKNKFLDENLRNKVAVCEGREDIKKAIKGLENGTVKMLIVSPQGMRDNAELLKAAGFGGERSFYFADEAHELATSLGGSQAEWAKAADTFAKSEYCAMASGTLIRSNGSELHSIYDKVHPGVLGTQKAFTSEWQRLAEGGDNFFNGEAMAGMRDRLSSGMISYHSEPKVNGRELELHREEKRVDLHPAQKAAIAKVNAEYERKRKSDNPEEKKGAAFWRERQTLKIINEGVKGEDGETINPKMDALMEVIDREKKGNPKAKVGVHYHEKAPLAAVRARATKAGHRFLKIDGDNDDKATSGVVGRVNGSDGVDGVTLGKNAVYGLNLTGLQRIVKMSPMQTASDDTQLDHRHLREGATEDKHVTTLIANHPAEDMKQFNLGRKGKQFKLLADLAGMADGSGASMILAKHGDELQATARGGK